MVYNMHYSLSYSDLRKKMKETFDKVTTEHTPIYVNRRNGEDVVILSKDDYESLEETAYLLRSPANAKRLIEALERNSQERVKFNNIKEFKDETGI